MAQPIQPPAPVNPVVTIQPVTTAIPNRESGAGPNPLANIANGTTVEGFVVNRDTQNNPIVRTAIGDLRVTSDVFLKTGSEVVFKVDASQSSLARIISVDGLTLQDYSAQNTHGLTKDTISASLFQQTARPTLSLNTKSNAPVLHALILQGQPQESPLNSALKTSQAGPLPVIAQLAQLRAGTPIRLTVLDLKLPPLPITLSSLPDNSKLHSLLPARPAQTAPLPIANAPLVPTPPATSAVASTATKSPATAQDPSRPSITELPTSTAASSSIPAATPTLARTVPTATPTTAASFFAGQSVETTHATTQQPTLAHTTKTQDNSVRTAQVFTPQHSDRVANYGRITSTASAPYVTSQPALTPHSNPTANHLFTAIPSPHALAHNAIDATVIGHDADGANILHTVFASIKLYTAQPLPTGTSLVVHASVEPHAEATSAPASSTIAAEENFASETTRQWKTLEDIITLLKQTNAQVAQEVVQRLPTLNSKLTSGLLFFIAAIKSGDVSELIGKRAMRLLEMTSPELLQKLRKDVSQIQSNSTASPLPQWLITQLPLIFGQELQHARLYISRDADHKDTPEAGHGQRFILEVGMSQLGPMQLDGFVRSRGQAKSFDLHIRSHHPLNDEITQGISSIFYHSMEATGLHGQLLFQAGGQHFIRPTRDTKPRPDTTSTNTILA